MPDYRRIPVRYPDPRVPVTAVATASGRPGTYHRHTDEDWEIWHVNSGRVSLRVSGKQHDLQDGDVFIIRPDQPHTCLTSHGRRYVLIFNRRFLKDVPVPVRGAGAAGLEVALRAVGVRAGESFHAGFEIICRGTACPVPTDVAKRHDLSNRL